MPEAHNSGIKAKCVSRESRDGTSESQLRLALLMYHVRFGYMSGPVHKLSANQHAYK